MNESSSNQNSSTEMLASKEDLGRHLEPFYPLRSDGKASAWETLAIERRSHEGIDPPKAETANTATIELLDCQANTSLITVE
jgi:hypothetical protein